eukprot:CAMPEP_0114287290 /NCGR_PEP_ID=MMETSP0059-20121206/6200_1 /TAXON_ID=36894 /ORGANISM="Pyramimonas parkeae, Strain CCMP726" /LENGTH=209 /DNA_ID=CAMNT_0001408363 /DNA_START=412 /DNA_END=1041 /DNA_ORIENTATION=+
MGLCSWATAYDRYDRWRDSLVSVWFVLQVYAYSSLCMQRVEEIYGSLSHTWTAYFLTSFSTILLTTIGMWAKWELVVLRITVRFLFIWPGPSILKHAHWSASFWLFTATDAAFSAVIPIYFSWFLERQSRRLFLSQHTSDNAGIEEATRPRTRLIDIWASHRKTIQELLEYRSPSIWGNADLLLYFLAPLMSSMWMNAMSSSCACAKTV